MKSRSAAAHSSTGEEFLFLRRWMANPLKVGAVIPSSPALARLVVRQINLKAEEAVVELGAGTGSVTKELLRAGIQPERLFVVEIDPQLCTFLRRQFPHAQVVQGDATRLPELIPSKWVGKVGCVISGIPMVPIPLHIQRKMIQAWFDVMTPKGLLLQYTYSLVSPLPEKKLGVKGKRRGVAVLNVPPAWVWSYTKAA
jgi:phosphatidylethanolamine/phosphatidyl-N-methylethanolamine N-methyltransferase